MILLALYLLLSTSGKFVNIIKICKTARQDCKLMSGLCCPPFFIQWELPRERQEEIFVSWKHKMQEIYHLCAKPQWVVAEKIQ